MQSRPWSRGARGPVQMAALVATLALTGCSAEPHQADPEPTRSAVGATVLALEFTDLATGPLAPGALIPAAVGGDATVIYPQAGDAPALQVVPDRDATALEFPDPCDLGAACVRGILEVPASEPLNPGTADFELRVRLRVNELRDGNNVVQKGFSTGGGSQWKLQIDNAAGQAECHLVDAAGVTQSASSSTTVADGGWHEVTCVRADGQLTIAVDGSISGRTIADPVLDITNSWGVRIGGKHTKPNGDPFFGELSSVTLSVAEDS